MQPSLEDQESSNYFMDLDGGESLESNVQNSNYLKSFDEGMLENGDKSIGTWSSSGHPSPFKEDIFESWGITQQLALDVLGSSDENSQENGGSIGGDFGHNLWLHLDQENSENWWMGDYFQINGGPELKVQAPPLEFENKGLESVDYPVSSRSSITNVDNNGHNNV